LPGKVDTDDGKDLFVHFKDVQGGVNAIKDNDNVEYEEEEGRKGLQAVNVKKV
jgi:CspA family cold shock protein